MTGAWRPVVAVVAGLVLTGCAGADGSVPGPQSGPAVVVDSPPADQGPFAGVEIRPPYPPPAATLTDSDGDPMTLPGGIAAPVQLYFFGYTRCPDICPLVMSDLALAVARLPADVADDVQVVFVTSDPTRDDPTALRAYLDRYDPDFIGLTGDLGTIVSLADGMGVSIEKGARLPSGGYEVQHGAQVVGYAGGRGVVLWTAGTSAEDMADDLVRMVGTATGRHG